VQFLTLMQFNFYRPQRFVTLQH